VREVVDAPIGSAPFRVYVDPADDGAEEVFRHGEDVRLRFYGRLGMVDLLRPTSPGSTGSTDSTDSTDTTNRTDSTPAPTEETP
jgi:hypothetical protein